MTYRIVKLYLHPYECYKFTFIYFICCILFYYIYLTYENKINIREKLIKYKQFFFVEPSFLYISTSNIKQSIENLGNKVNNSDIELENNPNNKNINQIYV